MARTSRQPADERFSFHDQFIVYAVAFFTGNVYLIVSVVMPLWALELGASPLIIGIIISSRAILVVTLSIYGGGLLDHFGPRIILIVFGLLGGALMGLYPLLPFIWTVVLIQMASGFMESTSWIGAQSLVGRILNGLPVYAGRMTAAARVGGFMGPWGIGLIWEHFGPTAAFWTIAVWVVCGAGAACLLPREAARAKQVSSAKSKDGLAKTASAEEEKEAPEKGPGLADYASAFRLLLIPAVALVIANTFFRQTGSGIQNSFYGVWLNQNGFTAGDIGFLFALAHIASAGAALSLGTLTRRFREHWLLVWVTILAVAAIAITPLLGDIVLLAFFIMLRGIGQGLNFPLMLSIASRAVGRHLQGRVIALRLTFNRLGGALVPLIMGALAEVIGLEPTFYVMGITGVVLLLGMGLWCSRMPEFQRPPSG